MDYLKQFSIPFKGMLDGSHEYSFSLDQDFFSRFEASPFQKGHIHADLFADKQGSLMNIDLEIRGSILTECDRCLAEIDLPIVGSYHFILKKANGISEDPDLYYIKPEDSEWNIATVLYEYTCLSIPFSKSIDCELKDPSPCNKDVLNRLQQEETNSEINPMWDELKKLNK